MKKTRQREFDFAKGKIQDIQDVNKPFYREFELERALVDEAERSVEMSFSSEQPVKRWFRDDEGNYFYGDEILLHGERNVDLTRLRKVGSLIYGHRAESVDNVIGPIKKVWVEDYRGKALAGFDDDDIGEKYLKKVKSKSLRGVSFAYMISKARVVRKDEEWQNPKTKIKYKGPALLATRWEPYEITLTPIPADASIGVGRENARSLTGIEIEISKQEEIDMKPEEVKAMIEEALKPFEIREVPKIEDIVQKVVEEVRKLIPAEQNKWREFAVSPEEFNGIMARAAAISDEAKSRMTEMLLEGKDATAMKDGLLQMVGTDADSNQTRKAGPGKDGTGIDEKTGGGQAVIHHKAEDMPDNDFVRMLAF